VLGQDRRNIILSQNEFIHVDIFIRDCEFNILAQVAKDDSNNYLTGWLKSGPNSGLC
jgi:hypothetical protein